MSRAPRQIVTARCVNDWCGYRADVGRVMPATLTDPSWIDGDVPDECPDCGSSPLITDTEWCDPTEEMDPYDD